MGLSAQSVAQRALAKIRSAFGPLRICVEMMFSDDDIIVDFYTFCYAARDKDNDETLHLAIADFLAHQLDSSDIASIVGQSCIETEILFADGVTVSDIMASLRKAAASDGFTRRIQEHTTSSHVNQ